MQPLFVKNLRGLMRKLRWRRLAAVTSHLVTQLWLCQSSWKTPTTKRTLAKRMLLTLERTSPPLQNIITHMTQGHIYDVSPPQHANNQYDLVQNMINRELPLKSTNEQAQEAPIAYNKHNRRGCTGVKRQIRNFFQRFCCCLFMPKAKDTTFRYRITRNGKWKMVRSENTHMYLICLFQKSFATDRWQPFIGHKS